MFSRASAASAASNSTSVTVSPSTRRASASPAAPTPEPSSTAYWPAWAGVAAASSTASWPKRWPRTGCRKTTLPPRSASSLIRSASAAIGTKLMTEARILEEAPRHLNFVVANKDPARENADRAFQDAHVVIGHDVPNPCTVEQRFDCRDKHWIGRADEFAHVQVPPAASRGARFRCKQLKTKQSTGNSPFRRAQARRSNRRW